MRKTAVEFRRAAFVLADLIEDNRDPVDTFASSGLYELTQLLAETRVLVGALTRISAQIESDPSQPASSGVRTKYKLVTVTAESLLQYAIPEAQVSRSISCGSACQW